jgi:hypothetical protein
MSRRIVATAIVGTIAAATVGVSVATAEAAENGRLVLHYDFEGDLSGGRVVDRSGSGLDGTLVSPAAAGTTTGADGSQALTLTGGPYVSIPNGLFRGLSAATISTWVKWAGGADFQWVYCIGKNQDAATFITPSFSGVSRARSSIKPVNGQEEVGVTASRKLPTDQWVNLVTTIDGRTIGYYINGVKIGSASASLDLAATMYTAGNTTSGFLGKPFWSGHPFLNGALDDFRVYDSAFGDAQVAALAGDHVATLTATGETTFDVTTTVGTAPSLPSVTGSYSDGIDRDIPVAWNAVDPAAYARSGTFTVTGTVTGTGLTATARVKVVAPGDLDIDLKATTGAFHGGASGTLYGLYGDGLPSRNLIEGINLRTVSTKAQDGPQHPGADALEIVKPLADATDGDVYIYMTDIYRGFPYEWPGSTPQARLDDFLTKIAKQVDQVLTLPAKYQDNIVFVPYNEPEGNMFGTGQWSYNKVSWLDDPQYFFAAWDRAYRLIKARMPSARIAGPNTSVLFDQVKGFLAHTVSAGTVPDVTTWHELSNPTSVRTSVARYRTWEDEILGGKHLPININEYAFNYHTSVPGQMIQWIAAIEESKVDADIAYWNIDGNLSDSAVQANRANGQWWLLHAYSRMTGQTVKVTPSFPDVSYTMQGVATVDESKRQARALFGGASGQGLVTFRNAGMFGRKVHALIQEIPWTGQIGNSREPNVVAELDRSVTDGTVSFDFGGSLPALDESAAYQIILTPVTGETSKAVPPTLWRAGYEAENATHTGTGWTRNGPEGTPSNVSKFYTSGNYNVGGLRTGSDVVLDFAVTVPKTGDYDLSVFANSLNTYAAVAEQGPTNVFLRVDGAAEQELHLPLGYKWVVWDHTDTTVALTAGDHVISLAARSLDGAKATKGDAIVDRITLALPNPAAKTAIYQAEHATLGGGATTDKGAVKLTAGKSVTFWVYAADDGEHTLRLDADGSTTLTVNGERTLGSKVFLSGGINKVVVTGKGTVDRLRVEKTTGKLVPAWYEAEAAIRAGTAAVTDYSQATGGKAVTGVGGVPGNTNTLTFDVTAPAAGTYALTVRYSNPEQSPASHYNPDPLARPADIAVNAGPKRRVLFPHTFHANNFWTLTIPVRLKAGHNTIRFSAEELTDFDAATYISDRYTEPLRSRNAPVIDRIGITRYSR